ncbi:hypothetical protein LLG96_07830 [bacterium]|nr:hypothetical protein [bacterium]
MAADLFSRRSFISAGAVSGVGAGFTTGAFARPETKSRTGLLKVGIILGGGNHAQNMWARLINAVPATNNIPYTPRRTGMVITHVWSVIPSWAEEFARTFGVEKVVGRFDDMVGKVDGLLIDAFFGTPYNHHLAKPYIESRTPVFLNRPFSDSIRKAEQIVDWAHKYNTPIMTGSSFEFLESTMNVRNRYPYEAVSEYDAYNATSDFYSHGVHGLLFAYACAGGNMEAVGHRTESWIKGGGMTSVVYKDRGKGPFIGKIHDFSIEQYLCAIKFRDSEQYYGFGPADWDQFMWIHLLQTIQVMFETGSMPDTHDRIVEKTAMFVAAFRSILREKGNLVGIDDLDEDWAIGPPWGHSGNPSQEEQDGYIRLFGEEKGELRPDRTMG